MTRSPFPQSGWMRGAIWVLGIILGNLAIAGLYLGLIALFAANNRPEWHTSPWREIGAAAILTVGLPSLFLVPLFGGGVASLIWSRLNPGIGPTTIASFLLTLTGMAGAAAFMGEGVICLLLVSPLYFAVILAGAMIGRVMFKADRSRLNLTVLPLLAVFAWVEMATRQDEVGLVSDEIIIQAPPDKVWPLVTSFPDIPNPPRFWLFRIGLPYPMATTTEGNFVGAKRACIFSGNAVFEEVVSEFEPGQRLGFEILKLPPDPELIGHLTPHRGRFSLRDNGDGSTTLIGDTWYTLHVRPLGYFRWWTEHIFRAVHLRVMKDIQRRAEEAS